MYNLDSGNRCHAGIPSADSFLVAAAVAVVSELASGSDAWPAAAAAFHQTAPSAPIVAAVAAVVSELASGSDV